MDNLTCSLGLDNPRTLEARNDLAMALLDQFKNREAMILFKECVDTSIAIYGENDNDTLRFMCNLANTYSSEIQLADAEELYKQCLKKRRALLGDNHY